MKLLHDWYYSLPQDIRGAVLTITLCIIVGLIYLVAVVPFKTRKENKLHTGRTTNGITFHHNGDWSGDLIVILPQEAVEPATGSQAMVTIDMETFKTIMAEYLRARTISNFEQMTPDEILDYSIMGHETDSDAFTCNYSADFERPPRDYLLRDGQHKIKN